MTQDKSDFLLKTYPQLFQSEEVRNDPMQSCMAWGFECGDGWFDILSDMCKKIAELNPPSFEFQQIKEKFGTLRVYWGAGAGEHWDTIDKIVREAEDKSEVTCETCGEPGHCQSVVGWYVTMCDIHLEAYKVRRNIHA